MRFSAKHFNFSEWVVLLSVTFNAILCFLTGMGLPIGSNHVIFSQVLIFGLISLYGFKYAHRNAIFLLVIIAFIFNLSISFILQNDVSVQNVYSMLVLPISIFFVIYSKIDSWKIIKPIFAVSFIITIFELLAPNLLLIFFPVGEYYINTREWVANQGIQDEVGYYIGALRSGGSYIFRDTQRIGSIFLESLGHSYFLMAFILAVRCNISNRLKKMALISIAILFILLTDSRVGVVLGLFLAVVPLKFTRVYIPTFVYLILIWLLVIISYNVVSHESFDVTLRLSYTLDVVWSMSLSQFLGIDPMFGKLNDSGYLVYFSSIGIMPFILLLVWIETIRYKRFTRKEKDTILPFTIVLFVTLFFGAAILSMKVIILWVALAFSPQVNSIRPSKTSPPTPL